MSNLTYEILKELYNKCKPYEPKCYIMCQADFDKLKIPTIKRRKNYYEIDGTGSFILISEFVEADKILVSTINLIAGATECNIV